MRHSFPMASLSDLGSIYGPSAEESGFTLANIQQATNVAENQAKIGRERTVRDYNRFDLPNLLGSQAGRGSFYSSATQNKQQQLATGAGDRLSDINLGLANVKANLATNGLLAQTGISLGSLL